MVTCGICGKTLQKRGRTPPLYCAPCRRFKNYLAAAERQVPHMTLDAGAAEPLRSWLFTIANSFPVATKRDAGGRFR